MPKEITSDGAPEFRGDLVKKFNEIFGIKHHIITPYRPQANGQIERIFRTIRAVLATLAEKKPRQWCRFLPYVAFAYNTAYHGSIRNTPFYIMFGRDPSIGLHSVLTPELEELEDFEDRISNLLIARSTLQEELWKAHQTNEDTYNVKTNPKDLKVGDVVFLRTPIVPASSIHKIYPRYVGPYRIRDVKGPTIGVVPLTTPEAEPKYIHSDRAKLISKDFVFDSSTPGLDLPFRREADPNLESSYEDSSLSETS